MECLNISVFKDGTFEVGGNAMTFDSVDFQSLQVKLWSGQFGNTRITIQQVKTERVNDPDCRSLSDPDTCPTCCGSGTMSDHPDDSTECPDCDGTGETPVIIHGQGSYARKIMPSDLLG